VIWSSGVLEHFSDEQIVGILRHSFRASRRTVMSLVPNARSLPYRLGKWIQESRGEWPWGHEDPKFSLASQFREAGLAGIREETIGAQHALNFLSGPDLHPMARALSAFYSQLPDGEADSLGQGYLLVTAGFVREPRRMAVIPSDPLDAYVAKGNSGWLQEYYNPTGVFEEVYCLSPVEPCQRWAFGMKVIPTQPHELPDRIRELRIDLVRCYGGFWPADMGCRNKIQGIPVVVSVHDTSEELLHDSIVDADHVIAVSAAVRGLLERRGVDPGRIHVLPNRVDVGVFRPLDRSLVEAEFTGRFPGKYHVLHVGRKSPEKNLETVIRALSILGPDYGALFIGQGDAAPYFDLAVSVGVADRCAFIPSVRNEQLPILFAYCDVLCTPSLREGFGMVFIEALSCGTPVVTSNIAPMTEYIRHGVNGLLVDDPRDASAVARAIRRICTDSELAQRLRIAGPESVTPFRKDQVDRREASLYRQFLEHRT
jgi:glycosyltransferase involved in cell wall biosynthesis